MSIPLLFLGTEFTEETVIDGLLQPELQIK
jgi:hypothetical protein